MAKCQVPLFAMSMMSYRPCIIFHCDVCKYMMCIVLVYCTSAYKYSFSAASMALGAFHQIIAMRQGHAKLIEPISRRICLRN